MGWPLRILLIDLRSLAEASDESTDFLGPRIARGRKLLDISAESDGQSRCVNVARIEIMCIVARIERFLCKPRDMLIVPSDLTGVHLQQ